MNKNERRRYFRVSDLIGLHYRFLTEGELDLAVKQQPISLKGVLGQIESEIARNLIEIRNTQPEIHQLLDLMNQKINLAFGHGLSEGEGGSEQSIKASQVSLSACGIAFSCNESAALNQHLSLELTLFPKNSRLQLLAAVISCDQFEDETHQDEYLIRADFVNTPDVDQEVLVQHVITRQVQQIKDDREGNPSSE